MLYVQSFTLIKSTGARISTGTGGIPSPTVKNIHSLIGIFIDMSMVYFRKLNSEVHDLHNATTYGSHRLQ
jgi:hypothetical protein